MGVEARPLDGDENIYATDNGPTHPNEEEILTLLFGEPVDGVYAPRED